MHGKRSLLTIDDPRGSAFSPDRDLNRPNRGNAIISVWAPALNEPAPRGQRKDDGIGEHWVHRIEVLHNARDMLLHFGTLIADEFVFVVTTDPRDPGDLIEFLRSERKRIERNLTILVDQECSTRKYGIRH